MRHTIRIRSLMGLVLVTIASCTLTACLKRKETIVVSADGRIAIEHDIRGDEGDISSGAALLPGQPDFKSKISKHNRDDGEVEFRLLAKASFASADLLPTNFSPDGDPEQLHFETEIQELKQNGDRRLFLFRRRYLARPWGKYAFLLRQSLPQDLRDHYDEVGDFSKLEGEKRDRAIKGLIDYEFRKMLLWAEEAVAVVAPGDWRKGLAMDRARSGIAEWRQKTLDGEIVRRLMGLEDAAIDHFCTDLTTEANQLIATAITAELKLDAAQRLLFASARSAAQRNHDVSEDLSDEDFEVLVKLPGRILSSGGGEQVGDALLFRFAGRDLRDRDHVIEVVYEIEAR